MAQTSFPWTSAGGVGDSANQGSEDQLSQWLRACFTSDRHFTEGVIPGVGGNLAVSGSATPITLASGAAYTDGFYYQNTANITFAIPTPQGGTTAHRVVLRADIVANTVRAALLSAADGTNTAPAVTQQDGVLWEIPLATVRVTVLGAITITDERDYCHVSPAFVERRRGGSATDWSTSGAVNYNPGGQVPQAGAATMVFDDDDERDSDTLTVYFPKPFSAKPLVWPQEISGGDATVRTINVTVVKTDKAYFQLKGQRPSGPDWLGSFTVQWLAFGPE